MRSEVGRAKRASLFAHNNPSVTLPRLSTEAHKWQRASMEESVHGLCSHRDNTLFGCHQSLSFLLLQIFANCTVPFWHWTCQVVSFHIVGGGTASLRLRLWLFPEITPTKFFSSLLFPRSLTSGFGVDKWVKTKDVRRKCSLLISWIRIKKKAQFSHLYMHNRKFPNDRFPHPM